MVNSSSSSSSSSSCSAASYFNFSSSSSSSSAFSSTGLLDAATVLRQDIQSEPFLQFNGLTNGTWLSFLIIAVASSRLGTLGPRFGLPLITTYMIVGCICGPYILNLVTTQELPDIAYITQIALSFIAFSAGSELYLPELRSLFRKIAYITSFNSLYTYILCALFIYGLAAAGVISWMTPYLGGCGVGISLIAASIMVARSPASAIAVVRELRAKGPTTSTMLGVTVVGDVVVLVLFTLSSSIALAQCSGNGFEGGAFIITVLTLVAAVGLGYLLGGLLIFLLWVPYARFIILPLGFIIFVWSDWFAVYSLKQFGVSINFDSLLICISAAYVCTNGSRNRAKFLQLLGSSASFIFIPFFTKVGVELNLAVLWQSLPFAFAVFSVRLVCIFLGTFTGGYLTQAARNEKLWIWMTMLAQAGVSLGLASEVAVKFPLWGRNFQTSVIAVVLINQFAGPVACKYALKSIFKEAGRMKEGEGEHGGGGGEGAGEAKVKRVLLVGVDLVALETAQRLLDRGYAVTLVDGDRKRLALTSVLECAQRDIVKVQGDGAGEGEGRAEEGGKAGLTKKKGKDEYAVLDPLEAERQESVLEEDADAPDVRRVADDDGGYDDGDDDGKDEEADASAAQLQTEQRIHTLLLPTLPNPGDPSSLVDAYTALLSPLLSSSLSTLHSAFVYLPADPDTLTVSSLLISTFHVHHVVARLHNTSWSSQAVSLGVVPLHPTSLTAHAAVRALTDGDAELVENDRVERGQLTSLPHVFASFISAGDERFLEWALPAEERERWVADHPGWTEEAEAVGRLSLEHLRGSHEWRGDHQRGAVVAEGELHGPHPGQQQRGRRGRHPGGDEGGHAGLPQPVGHGRGRS